MSDYDGVRLHVVTGKGGTGKTTVAAALALALASGGRQVLLVEVEGRQGIAQLFDSPPLPHAERKVAVARDGGDVYALSVDIDEAVLDYLDQFHGLRRAARPLQRMGALDFATSVAPGIRDVLLTMAVKEAVVRRAKGGVPAYDAVVLDAPPTGRIGHFLNVSAEVVGLAKVGPIRKQADGVVAVLRSTQTAVHVVTLLEDMPVQESLDAVAELRGLGLPVGGVVVNAARSSRLDASMLRRAAEGRLERSELVRAAKAGGLELDEDEVDAILAEAGEHARRLHLEDAKRAELHALDLPCYELPLLSEAVDLTALYELAAVLQAEGMA
ncbi:MAG: ArsA-related P-loop ATPase [Mycobacteriales bacterium]